MATYDVAVLGAGPGGYVAAIRAAQYGAKVCVVEAGELGGTCLNRGCIPSKALLESVHVLKTMRAAEEWGLVCENPGYDLAKVYARKDRIVETLRKGIAALFKKNGIDLVVGRGRLRDAGTLEVEGHGPVKAKKIILATGTTPLEPSFLPVDGENVVTSDYFLDLKELPESVLVIGGGYIGCEMATILHGLGAEVTVVEMLPRLVPMADEAVAKELRKIFKKARIGLHLETRVESLEVVRPLEVRATLSGGKEVTVEKALVCIGRSRCVDGIGLEEAGVRVDERGAVEVDEHCRTSLAGVYAIGDMTGYPQLAHVASKMGLVAAAHATGREEHANFDVVPSAIFTQPEIGNVGLSEAEAREAGRKVKCATFNYGALGKAMALGETAGFFKIVADEETGEVLGVHIIGPHASDIIGEAALALQLECTVEEIAHTIHAHPTLYEGMMECAETWLGLGIHS